MQVHVQQIRGGTQDAASLQLPEGTKVPLRETRCHSTKGCDRGPGKVPVLQEKHAFVLRAWNFSYFVGSEGLRIETQGWTVSGRSEFPGSLSYVASRKRKEFKIPFSPGNFFLFCFPRIV